jgi:glycosyltransferase involved in cell wall biosynthesis
MATILYVNATAVHGGAEEALLHLMMAALELGHRPVLVTPHAGWLTERAGENGIACETVTALPDTMTTDSWSAQLRPWLPAALGIAAIARRHRAALVHSNSVRAGYHGGLAARLAGVRSITHCYEIIGIPYRSRARAWILDRLTDWTLVVSNAVRDEILAHAPELRNRLSTLYLAHDASMEAGVEPADLCRLFDLPAGAVVIGNAAAMTPWKGQDVLVDAFRLVSDEIPQARLLLMGGSQGSARQNSFEEALRKKVAACGLEDRITFTGWREDWLSLLASFDIFVHATTGADPLPTVLIRGGALGRAIVATPLGGIPEILGEDAGVLVPPGDAGALAGALKSLAGDPLRRAELGRRARERIGRDFSWERMRNALGAVYERLLGARSPEATRSSR